MSLIFLKGIELKRPETYQQQLSFSSVVAFSEDQRSRRARAKKGKLINTIHFCSFIFVQNNGINLYGITAYEVDTCKLF